MERVKQFYQVTFLGETSELLTPEEFAQLQQECREIAEYGAEVEDAETFGEKIGRLAKFLAGPGPSMEEVLEDTQEVVEKSDATNRHHVRLPVTWQEAIQAWADGKKVSYSFMGYDKRFVFEDSNTMMSIEKVKNAEWYVED